MPRDSLHDQIERARLDGCLWEGGLARIIVTGRFISAAGMVTSVGVRHLPVGEDGSTGQWAQVRTILEPGETSVSLGRGIVEFDIAGPEGQPWKAEAVLRSETKQPSAQVQRAKDIKEMLRTGTVPPPEVVVAPRKTRH